MSAKPLLKLFLVSFLLALTTWTAAAKVHNLQLDRLTVEDGLSQGSVDKIIQDNYGFLWFATQSGVDIYDGHALKKLKVPKALENQRVYNIYKDSSGNVWLNFGASGLYKYSPADDVFHFISKHKINGSNDFINGIVEGENGDFWVTTTKSLMFFDGTTSKLSRKIDFKSLFEGEQWVNTIQYSNGYVFIGTSIGTYIYKPMQDKWKKLPKVTSNLALLDDFSEIESSKIYELYVSEQPLLYLGTGNGVYSIEIKSLDEFLNEGTPLPDYQVVLSNVDTWTFYRKNNFLYVTGSNGISVIDLADNSTEFLFGLSDDNDGITDNRIKSMVIDQYNQFWLGSSATGVYMWNPKREKIKNFSYEKNQLNSLSNNEVWALAKGESENEVWAATPNGLNLIELEEEKVSRFLVNESVNNSTHHAGNIFNMQKDNLGRLWLNTAMGIRLFDTKTRELVELPFSEELKQKLSKDIVNIYIDKYDQLWVITYTDVFRLNLETGEAEYLPEITTKVDVNILYNFLGYMPDSNVMLLSANESLWAYDTQSRSIKLIQKIVNVREAEWAPPVNVIVESELIWVAYSDGKIFALSTDSYDIIHQITNKSHTQFPNELYGLQSDKEGDIWFTSHAGLFLLSKESLHLRHFDKGEGLATLEFNMGASLQMSQGEIFYGSMAGVTTFDPLVLKQDRDERSIDIKLTNVDTLSRDLNFPMIWNANDAIELEYSDVGITFNFTSFTFADKGSMLFEFALTGIDDVAYPLTRKNSITFASLSSGRHQLKVRAKSAESGKYSAESTFDIYVSYALWASPLAYSLYAIFIFIVVTLIYVRRLKQRHVLLRAHEEVKVREKRLQLALIGSNSDVWEWQAKENMMFGNRLSKDLEFTDVGLSYGFHDHIQAIHPEDKEQFLATWHIFIKNRDTDDNFSCIYRMRHINGDWLWYKDLGKIVSSSPAGEPLCITGSYMNITQTRADEERAQYFGEAFRQTKDWVLIITENFSQVTANQSFREVFNWKEETNQFNPRLLGINKERWVYYRRLLPTLSEGEFWRGEELITTDNRAEYHVLVNINVSRNEKTNSLHYVCIFTDITAQKNAEKELRYLANYDHLTDLPNRALLLERIKHAMDYSKRMSSSIALFFIDLDKFKQVNDSIGHDFGDLLLIAITKRLSDTLRVDDTIARIGGDEFVILLESFRGSSHLGKIAQKIINVVEQPVDLQGNIASVGASIGIALYPDDAKSSDELLKNADVAMYQAKQIGRNTFQFFTPRMNHEANQRLQKERQLKNAQLNQEFVNHYQPIIDVHSGKIIGGEMLLRWRSEQGLLLPEEFITLAEELRVMPDISEAAIERSLQNLSEWQKIYPDLFVSINLSSLHFVDENLVKKLKSMLTKYGISAESLRIEVTENTLMSEPEKVIGVLRSLVGIGMSISLDDFGLGYSSLSYLKKLPIDVIKIDRRFVMGINREQADNAIVESISVLAKSLGIECIAVGVEKPEQLKFLLAHECHKVQGFMFSQPIIADAFADFLQENTVKQKIIAIR